MHLATVPSGIRWVSWSRIAGQRRVVGDPAGERGRDRDDGAPAAHLRAVGVHHHAVGPCRDRAAPGARGPAAARRAPPPCRIAHELRAADEAVLLCAALGVEQHLEAAGRVDVEEHVEQRHVLGLRRPDRLDPELEQASAPRCVTRLRRIQVAAVWESSRAASGASQGASSGTLRASRLSLRWARSTSTSTSGLIRGIAPL